MRRRPLVGADGSFRESATADAGGGGLRCSRFSSPSCARAVRSLDPVLDSRRGVGMSLVGVRAEPDGGRRRGHRYARPRPARTRWSTSVPVTDASSSSPPARVPPRSASSARSPLVARSRDNARMAGVGIPREVRPRGRDDPAEPSSRSATVVTMFLTRGRASRCSCRGWSRSSSRARASCPTRGRFPGWRPVLRRAGRWRRRPHVARLPLSVSRGRCVRPRACTGGS